MPATLQPGLLPILSQGNANTLETFLDHDIQQFILRSHGLTQAEYQNNWRALESLKAEWDFEYLLHHYDELLPQSQAIGLHLTAHSKPLREARTQYGPEALLGYSAHSLDEALKAEDDGADYILLGAIFPTPKENPEHPILGIDVLQQTCTRLTLPVFAIGGITSENLWQIHAAGAYGFCALRALFENEGLDHNIGKLKWTWDRLQIEDA